MSRATIELVYFDGCPHVASARERLTHVLRALGLPDHWAEWRSDDPGLPETLRGRPSPTVFVNGRDVMDNPVATEDAMSCAAAGAPSTERLSAALAGTQLDR